MNDCKNIRPQVLLIGNGLNRTFGGVSWGGIIDEINVRTDIDSKYLNTHNVPMPLQAILVTNDNIKDAMKNSRDAFYGKNNNEELQSILQKLLSVGFDDILTTNYSYEIECAATNTADISDYKLKKMTECAIGKAEPKYLIHTYNHVDFRGNENRIWHIHGEARKPDSMILGHYWYSGQLARMKEESDSSQDSYMRAQKEGKPQVYNSWIDSFILGDVYILGLGFDFSEIDLWWLLNRKGREKADKGKTYFYEMKSEKEYAKTELLRLFGAEPISFGINAPESDDPACGDIYKDFYRRAIKDIEEKINNK